MRGGRHMLTMQGISARKSAVAPVLAVVLALLCTLWPAPLRAWPQGGVPQAVWQDSERNNRRSPSQIKRQLRPPQVRAAQLPLADDAQDQRAAKTRGLIAANAAPLAAPPASGDQLPMLEQGEWRLKVAPAAVTNTDSVLLGDIAAPLGHMDPALWSDLKSRRLWPAPPEEGKPLQINRSRLSQALRQSLGNELAARCILPTSLVIQRGGLVFREDDLRSYVVKSLTPQLSAMPGEAELNEFRLPEYIFLAHSQQRVQLEPGKLTPGRVPLRFAVQEADGTVLRRVSGTVNLTLWITVPAASRPLGKGDALTPEAVTFMRINASQLMVRRGTILSLIYTRGNLRMTTQAEALADGEPGATIPVRNLQTKKQIYATVKDGSTVEIH